MGGSRLYSNIGNEGENAGILNGFEWATFMEDHHNHHPPVTERRKQGNRDARAKASADESSEDAHYSRCVALNECLKCSADDMERVDLGRKDATTVACAATGRRQHFDCVLEPDGISGDDGVDVATLDEQSGERISNNDDTSTSSQHHRHARVWKSCASTPRDDFVKVVWMQILCLIVGLLSCKIVSRQKRMHASLFDQRRYNSMQQRRQPAQQQQQQPKPPSAPASATTRPVKRNASDIVSSNQQEDGDASEDNKNKETEMISLLSPLSMKDPK